MANKVVDKDFDSVFTSACFVEEGRASAPRLPEQNLWLAVLALEVQDATDPKLTSQNFPGAKGLKENMQKQARTFILDEIGTTAAYFEMICDFAGVSPEFIRRGVKKMIAEGRAIKAEEIMAVYTKTEK